MVCMLASSMLLPGVACCGSEGESMLGGSGVGEMQMQCETKRRHFLRGCLN
jgi:hypothetical protein